MTGVESHLDADLADVQPARLRPTSPPHASAPNAILGRQGIRYLQRAVASRPDHGRPLPLARPPARPRRRLRLPLPWIGPVLEWFLGSLACALLLVWAFRGVASPAGPHPARRRAPHPATDERVLNWMHEAEEHASRQRFRDGRPLPLLGQHRHARRPPSLAARPRPALRANTSASSIPLRPCRRFSAARHFSFETIWYGLRPAARPDYDHALDLHRRLRSA